MVHGKEATSNNAPETGSPGSMGDSPAPPSNHMISIDLKGAGPDKSPTAIITFPYDPVIARMISSSFKNRSFNSEKPAWTVRLESRRDLQIIAKLLFERPEFVTTHAPTDGMLESTVDAYARNAPTRQKERLEKMKDNFTAEAIDGAIRLQSPYYEDWLNAIRQVPSAHRKYDGELKAWDICSNQEALAILLAAGQKAEFPEHVLALIKQIQSGTRRSGANDNTDGGFSNGQEAQMDNEEHALGANMRAPITEKMQREDSNTETAYEPTSAVDVGEPICPDEEFSHRSGPSRTSRSGPGM